MIGKGGQSLTITDLFVRLKDIPESDIRGIGLVYNRDEYCARLWNGRKVYLTGLEAFLYGT